METTAECKKSADIPTFKSYYVVWKLFGFFATNRASAVFKSYYVVWKLAPAATPTKYGFCLNRTMQYGNKNI